MHTGICEQNAKLDLDEKSLETIRKSKFDWDG